MAQQYFYEAQGVPELLWTPARMAIRQKAFFGHDTLAPTAVTGASWALGFGLGHVWIVAAQFSTDTNISLTTLRCNQDPGMTAGTLRAADFGLNPPSAIYEAAVANPAHVVQTFGKRFFAANTTTDLLMGGTYVLGSSAAIAWQTAAIVANCSLAVWWAEFDD